ncbi:hypothetical protein B566_EDAN013848 [Ephemera danica]|nr:hypothetical protein B566_EDAN013848 [Ephemera danica]
MSMSRDLFADMFMWIGDAKNRTGDPVEPSDFCGFALYPDCPLKGGNADCGDPTCCRPDQGPPVSPDVGAGYWGENRCDMPLHTWTSMVQQAATTHPTPEYVTFTGDVVDDGIWETSREHNTALFEIVVNEIRTNFPTVPLFPIFGNHEPHPLNVYSSGDWTEVPQNVSQQWIYQLAADTWGAWLGPGITSTVMRAGYYSYLLRSDLLIVALNTNICYTYNWWLIYDSVDIGGQLVWLAQTLLQAETAGQKVHLLTHLSGDEGECFAPWQTEYNRIVDRFENTITAQFFGHTHDDLMNVYYALEDSNLPTRNSFSGGSGTPEAGRAVNPNYKAYTLEGAYPGSEYVPNDHLPTVCHTVALLFVTTLLKKCKLLTMQRVLDAESWTFNLTEANLAGSVVPPNWQKLYSFNEAYGTTSMLPAELDALVHRMAANVTLQQQYFEFAVRRNDKALAGGCDEVCLRDFVCGIVSSTPGKCDELPWPASP